MELFFKDNFYDRMYFHAPIPKLNILQRLETFHILGRLRKLFW